MALTEQQEAALRRLCANYKVEFDPEHYHPQFDLPNGYVAGWVGGPLYSTLDGANGVYQTTIYVGCSPEGDISS